MTDEEKKRQLEQLLHAINHDLRTPLSNIRSATAILLQNLTDPLTDDQRGFVEIIERSTVRLLDQTTRLVLFGQIAFLAGPLEAVYLSEILGNVKRHLKNIYDIDTVTILTDGDPLLLANVHTLSITLALLAVGDIKHQPETTADDLPAIHVHTLPEEVCFTIHSQMADHEMSISFVELTQEIVQQHDGILVFGEVDGQKQFSFCLPHIPPAD